MIELKYNSIKDAVLEQGAIAEIQDVFIGFQEHLYARQCPIRET